MRDFAIAFALMEERVDCQTIAPVMDLTELSAHARRDMLEKGAILIVSLSTSFNKREIIHRL